jgi:hypothetical protein
MSVPWMRMCMSRRVACNICVWLSALWAGCSRLDASHSTDANKWCRYTSVLRTARRTACAFARLWVRPFRVKSAIPNASLGAE